MQRSNKKRQSLSSSDQIVTEDTKKQQQNHRKQLMLRMTSNQDCLTVLVILMIIFVVFSGILGYSIYQSLTTANSRLQKIELKFHKFLFYIKYIYKSEKIQQQMSKQQNNSISNFLNKISKGFQQKKQPKQQIQKSISVNEKTKKTIIVESKESNKENQRSENANNIELLSQEQMIDIAIKIIEQQQQTQVKITQETTKQVNPEIETNQQNQQTQTVSNDQLITSQGNQIQTFSCNIDEQNIFYKNFQFNPQTLRLRKTKYTSSFQSIFCDQPIPNSGIYQFPIKIIRTLKSFIYIGIAGGNKTEVYNVTSLHESHNFYGYSGYSGRIWQAKKRKNSYEIFQTNTILKLRVNMNSSLIQYFFNEIKVGQSNFGKLCQTECRFLIQMRDDGDQIQFLQTLKIDNLNITTTTPVINQL